MTYLCVAIVYKALINALFSSSYYSYGHENTLCYIYISHNKIITLKRFERNKIQTITSIILTSQQYDSNISLLFTLSNISKVLNAKKTYFIL